MNNPNDKDARGGALMALGILVLVFVIVTLLVLFLVEAGFISLQ